MVRTLLLVACLTISAVSLAQTTTHPATVTVKVENAPKSISRDLFGALFEDLNYAADGGLYAEFVQNRSFEYQATSSARLPLCRRRTCLSRSWVSLRIARRRTRWR